MTAFQSLLRRILFSDGRGVNNMRYYEFFDMNIDDSIKRIILEKNADLEVVLNILMNAKNKAVYGNEIINITEQEKMLFNKLIYETFVERNIV